MGGLFLLGGIGFAFTLLVPVILIVALLVILALRHDDDADEQRAPAIYGAVVAFVALFTLLFAAAGLSASLVELSAPDSGGAISVDDGMQGESFDGGSFDGGSSEDEDDDDAAISSAVGFLIAGLAAVALLVVHRSLFDRRRSATGAARRVHRAYVLVLCLAAAVVATIAGALALFAVWQAIAPGIAGGSRGDALRSLVPMIVLFAGAALLWERHWRELDLAAETGISGATAP